MSLGSYFPTSPKVMPNTLPHAEYKKPYYAKIKITGGGSGGLDDYTVKYSPDNSGLVLVVDNPNYPPARNNLSIKGIPVVDEKIIIEISGSLIACANRCYFYKKYEIKVD